jgi:hypothetical protein
MDKILFEQLHASGLISDQALKAICDKEANRQVSVHWDLRILLYLGVLLVSAGLGILLYKHIDTIGHAILLAIAALAAAGCFTYCFLRALPYSAGRVAPPNVWFDYVLLLGCLLLLTFMGYLQFQYQVFGSRWGLATFMPMLLLFALAYYFDHRGVLSLAITNLGAWMGVAIEPMQLMRTGWSGNNMVVNGLILGCTLHLACWLALRFEVKSHFETVYRNFGAHILFISLLAAMGVFHHYYIVWFLVLMVFSGYYIYRSMSAGNFYYLVMAVLYSYAGLSYVVVRFLILLNNMTAVYLIIFYFIGSGLALVKLLMHFNRKLKQNDSI